MSDNLTITVIIPAWNESDTIAASIQSLYRQSRQPDRIVVVPNNTTDQTSVVTFAAGALNFAMDSMDNRFDEQENAALLVMDADTLLELDFIEKAEIKMLEDEFIGGVSSIFEGRDFKKYLVFHNNSNLLVMAILFVAKQKFSCFRGQLRSFVGKL